MLFTQDGFPARQACWLDSANVIAWSAPSLFRLKKLRSQEFKYDSGGAANGAAITLFANRREFGEGRVEETALFKYSLFEGRDIGEDSSSPIDFSYPPPFKLAGKLDWMIVELK